MILTKFRVKNYLSINGECEVPTDPKVTVLLGANDHGKSNLLRSLEHLNIDRPILDTDENWDSKGAKIEFEFHLNDAEAASLTDAVERIHDQYLSVFQDAVSSDEEELSESSPIVPAPVLPSVSVVGAGQNSIVAAAPRNVALAPNLIASSADDENPEELLAEYKFAKSAISCLPTLVLSREGVGSALSIAGRALNEFPDKFYEALEGMIPRVELFKTFSGELQDSVTAEEIGDDNSEFLQGIFFYAGLDPLNCESLFIQDDETDKTLEEASARLDEALRRRWAQGVDLDLHFQLKHRGNSIELLVEDPAVRRRKVRMSQRSAGVTQFFRLSIVLHARRHKNPSNSYIYVFDEPGVFLHPKGQKDLLAVFEQLAIDTQIVYATHSLFMLNQNFPERHRLIAKSESSTVVDSKPYRANWKYAVDALGVRLTANILFSPNILLVEGDSDPIYLYEMLRLLNDADELDADANLLGIMSYGDLPNLRFLIQTFKSESSDRVLSVLFEGDAQGKQYQKDIASLTKRFDLKNIFLESGQAIEDYCLNPELFVDAAEKTLRDSYEAMDRKIPTDLSEVIRSSWNEFQTRKTGKAAATNRKQAEATVEKDGKENDGSNPETLITNAGAWFKGLSIRLIDNGSSKVALARNYAFLSREHGTLKGIDPRRLHAAKTLAMQISNTLGLPSRKAKQEIGA